MDQKQSAPNRGKGDLPQWIKQLRQKMNLTQEQFAARVGVTFSTVNRWENGRGKPSPLALARINDMMKEVRSRRR